MTAVAATLSWAAVFAARSPAIHLQARFEDPSGAHAVELWRSSDGFVRRDTDDALTLLISPAGDEQRFEMLDHHRKLRIQVSRSSLHRLGVFSDAASLAHLVQRPTGSYQLTDEKKRARTPFGECHWFALAAPAGTPAQHICYSAKWGVPLLVRGADGQNRLEVRSIDRAVDHTIFSPAFPGYGEVDADQEIRPED